MENNVKNVFTKGLWIYSILFLIRYFLLPIETFYDFIGAAGEVIFITFIIIGVFLYISNTYVLYIIMLKKY